MNMIDTAIDVSSEEIPKTETAPIDRWRRLAGLILSVFVPLALGLAPLPLDPVARKALAKIIKVAVAGGDDPKVVANVVLKAANAKHPKLRYAAGKLACRLSFLRRFAPAALVDMGIRKEMKLDSLHQIAGQL